MEEIIRQINDRRFISDIEFDEEDGKIKLWSKRSKYKISIPKKVDERISYLCGVLLGDGNINVGKKHINYPRMRIRIFNKSKSFLENVNKEFLDIFNVCGKLTKKKDKNCYILTIHRRIVVIYFLKIIGLSSGKKINLVIPKMLRNREFFKYFLAGLYDTDGFKTDTFGIMMQGSNYEFLKNIINLLNRFYGVKSRKLYYGTIKTPFGIRSRCQFHIKSESMDKFINIIPLRHNRWILDGPVV
ncbi:MAG: hypothetical protein GOV02_03450 [Candidatus Aenigmarchaeota archaeon]|nr:hypothetical protein [Candidatus Aenigmarchaeota archaeon]